MVAFGKGTWDGMLDNVVNFYYGYAQIQKKGYWDDQNINKSFEYTSELTQLLEDIPELKSYTPRLESFALASYDSQTNGMLVIGSDPQREEALTNLKEKIISGDYFEENDQAVMVAEGAAKALKITTGDTLVLISQGYHGVNAAGKYPVKGIVKFASPDLNKKMVYLPLKEAQYFFGAPDLITSLALKIEDRKDLQKVSKKIKSRLDPEKYDVLDWQEMIPDLVQAKNADMAGNYIMLVVLYVLITFGIFGTILMMTKEREYEFGVLISIGMKRRLLAFITWLEVVILGIMGAFVGILACIPLVYYFSVNPIDMSQSGDGLSGLYEKWGFTPEMSTSFEVGIFFDQAVVVFCLTSILAIYAIYQISKLRVMEAMRP